MPSPRKLPRIDRSQLRTRSAKRRPSKLQLSQQAAPSAPGASVASFLEGLPDVLAARDLRQAIADGVRARARGRTLLWGLGAHVIKVGLAPVLIDLLERGFVSALMLNGAVCIHDLELALLGRTSEDVGPALDDGSFGMARETAERLNAAIRAGNADGIGMGAAIGREILGGRYPHRRHSLLAQATRLGVPVTVHSAIGTDIHHMHASADGAALGATSHRDFETLAAVVAGLEGGVVFHLGSAVILPEVFLKALSLARNLGHRVRRFTAVDVDFVRQYRPQQNIVLRPTRQGGRGISLTGHHEILLPLIAAGLVDGAESARRRRGSR